VKIIKQKISGRLEVLPDRVVVWWANGASARDASSSDASSTNASSTNAAANPAPNIYLSFALVTLGPEEHVLPSFLLDDWGTEIKSLKLYRWIREYGEQFPRAELFGYGVNGESHQHFLRELELQSPYPCYAFEATDVPLVEAKIVTDLYIPDLTASAARPIAMPPEIEYPLRGAAVRWWTVPTDIHSLALLERAES